MHDRFQRYGLALATAFGLFQPAAAQLPRKPTLQPIAEFPNAWVRDRSEPTFIQLLPDGGSRIGGYGADVLVLHDLDASGAVRGHQIIRAGGGSSGLPSFSAASDGRTYAFGTSPFDCRLARIGPAGAIEYAVEVDLPDTRTPRGGAPCQGFASFSDGTAVMADFDPVLVEVSADGSSQRQVPLAFPADVYPYMTAMVSDGSKLLVPGNRSLPGDSARWLGAFDRNGALLWSHTFATTSADSERLRLKMDGTTAALLLVDELNNGPQTVRFARVDAQGNATEGSTGPTLPYGYTHQFEAANGRMAAAFIGHSERYTVVDTGTGAPLHFPRAASFDFGPGDTLWLTGLVAPCSFSGCQGQAERVDFAGNTLAQIVLPQSFSLSEIRAGADGRLVVAGRDRFLNGLGNFVEGSTYGAVVPAGQSPVERALMHEDDATVNHVHRSGTDHYATLISDDYELARIDGGGRLRFRVPLTGTVLTAGPAGAWVGPDVTRVQRVAPDGQTTPMVELPGPPSASQRYATTGPDGRLWLLSADSASRRMQLAEVLTDGTVARNLALPLLPAGGQVIGLIGRHGDWLIQTDGRVRWSGPDGALLHEIPAVANAVVLDDSEAGALLLTTASTLERWERAGNRRWQAALPAPPASGLCARWSQPRAGIQLRVLRACNPSSLSHDLWIQRWDLVNGTLLRSTHVPWDEAQLGPGYSSGAFQSSADRRYLADLSGELIWHVYGAGRNAVRFALDQPVAHEGLPGPTQVAHHGWFDRAGELHLLSPTDGITGARRIATFGNGLLGDGFED